MSSPGTARSISKALMRVNSKAFILISEFVNNDGLEKKPERHNLLNKGESVTDASPLSTQKAHHVPPDARNCGDGLGKVVPSVRTGGWVRRDFVNLIVRL